LQVVQRTQAGDLAAEFQGAYVNYPELAALIDGIAECRRGSEQVCALRAAPRLVPWALMLFEGGDSV